MANGVRRVGWNWDRNRACCAWSGWVVVAIVRFGGAILACRSSVRIERSVRDDIGGVIVSDSPVLD